LKQIREANGTNPDAPPLLSDEERKKAELALPFYSFHTSDDPSLAFAKTQHSIPAPASPAPDPEHVSHIEESSVAGSPSSELRMSQISAFSNCSSPSTLGIKRRINKRKLADSIL
jgi:hypothetical protein